MLTIFGQIILGPIGTASAGDIKPDEDNLAQAVSSESEPVVEAKPKKTEYSIVQEKTENDETQKILEDSIEGKVETPKQPRGEREKPIHSADNPKSADEEEDEEEDSEIKFNPVMPTRRDSKLA